MIVPRPATLKKYGLTLADFREMYNLQGGLCPICEKPLDKRICIDHFHIKNWAKLPDEERKKYVRGLLHWFCNHYYLAKGITIQKSKNVTAYLERFEKRKPR